MATQYWYQNAVFYEVSIRSFYDSSGDGIGDLRGLTQKLDYLKDLGVDCLWLLPIYKSPLKDDGYDIADFYTINPDYGNVDDFQDLIAAAHQRNIKIVMDLVMNHTSDEHPWFKAARSDRNSPYHNYYVWNERNDKYSQARIIFLDTEISNWTWNQETLEFYWHRFYSCQPDLNYDNPAVVNEMKKIVHFWFEKGIDGFRVDAVPYLIEREGTNCENLPETHAILKDLRKFVDENYSDKVLICEANQWPQEVVQYFGEGKEFHMAFDFPSMPRMFMALNQADSTPIHWALDQLPDIPENCQWGTFLRNHDELTLEMVSKSERQFMWDAYSPDHRYRINLGIRRRLAPLMENDRRKLELIYALLFSLPGSPFIYYGDEIGMGDNVDLFDRNGLRTPMQWEDGKNAGFSTAENIYLPTVSDETYAPTRVNVSDQVSDPASFWHVLQNMIKLQKTFPAFSSHALQWIHCERKEAAVFCRGEGPDRILTIFNLSSNPVRITIPLENCASTQLTNLFSMQNYLFTNKTLKLELSPYQYLWLKEPENY